MDRKQDNSSGKTVSHSLKILTSLSILDEERYYAPPSKSTLRKKAKRTVGSDEEESQSEMPASTINAAQEDFVDDFSINDQNKVAEHLIDAEIAKVQRELKEDLKGKKRDEKRKQKDELARVKKESK